MSFNKEQFVRDRPFGKFNNSLLKDIEYVKEIKKIILETKLQYAVPVYNFDNSFSNTIDIDNLYNQNADFMFLFSNNVNQYLLNKW